MTRRADPGKDRRVRFSIRPAAIRRSETIRFRHLHTPVLFVAAFRHHPRIVRPRFGLYSVRRFAGGASRPQARLSEISPCRPGIAKKERAGHRKKRARRRKKRAGPRNEIRLRSCDGIPPQTISWSAPQQASLRGPQPSNRPERAPRRASRRAPPPRTPAPRWGRCRGCRAGRMPDRKESRA